MDDRKWERWSALGGILFVVLTLASAFLPGSPPNTSDSAAKVAKYVNDNGDALRWAGYLSALAFLPFAWWLGALWRTIRRGEGGSPRLAVVAVAGGVFASVFGALGAVILGAVAIYGADKLGPSGTKFFYILSTSVGSLTLFGIAVLVSAAGAVAVRTGVLPRALGWFGALVALVAVLGGAVVASTRDAYFVIAFAAYMGASIWVLIASVVMLRGARDNVGAEAASAA